MADPSVAIATYILAKDGNRPWLMQRAFALDAILAVEVRTDLISFPSSASGLEEITDVLVRRFSRENENVYTFCLCLPPRSAGRRFTCDWLVGMSRVDNGVLRVGCGRYDWTFRDSDPAIVERLKITIETMEVMPNENLHPVMGWLGALPYPWCPRADAQSSMPGLRALQGVADYLRRG